MTQQPEALNLEEFRAKVTRAAREPLLARIEDLEAQLSAIGAGGVEPLRKLAAVPQAVPVAWRYQTQTGWHATTDADAAIRVNAHHPIEPLYTHPTQQGLEADLTDEQIDEAFNQMPDGAYGFLKSWGYRQFARAVLAAQAKQGERP